ncbi:sensor domain-containing protein [Mycobacterium sp. 050134]|uniref:sensor domain-containing protein n=1 Tax=Mycobacterium sp. 050134 TaxID=3096111 RepID=UPI002EDB3469
MPLFISYSSQDRSTVDALTTALRRAQQQVWFDQELGGGESWWNKILEQIRSCDVFIVALSNNWLQSKPSQAELRYARALNRPILPVQIGDIDSMRVNPLATLQIIDYRDPTVDAGIQLVTAVHALQSTPVPLPDPLPDEPAVPFGYITRMGNTLSEKELSPQQQTQLLIELRTGFDEDGDDPSARGDIAQLLRMLRLRHDVTYRTRTEIDNVLAEIEARDRSAEGTPAPEDAATQRVTAPSPAPPASAAAAQPAASGAATKRSNKRLLVIGGAAAAVMAAIAVVAVVATQGGNSKPAPKASPGQTPSATASANPTKPDSYLLGAQEIGTIVGDPNMIVSDKVDQLRTTRGTLSLPDCIGAYEPIEDSAYSGATGFVGARGQAVHSPGENQARRAFESVVTFASADNARAFVDASAEKWKACAGQAVTMAVNGKTYAYTFGQVTGVAPRIAQERVPSDGGDRVCHHVLHAASEVVIDVLLCGVDVAPGEAGRIAEQIAGRVAQQ